jgi:hypothetical protein
MSQYDSVVEKQRLKLEAEVWAKQVKCIHAHSLTSLWYEENPEDLEHGSVIDVEFNSGVIERTLSDGTKRTIGKRLGINEIVDEYKNRNMG